MRAHRAARASLPHRSAPTITKSTKRPAEEPKGKGKGAKGKDAAAGAKKSKGVGGGAKGGGAGKK